MSNPYEYDPELDSDIYEPEESSRSSSKSRNISRSLDDLLRKGDFEGLIDKLTMKKHVPEYAKMASSFLTFFSGCHHINEKSSFNRAVITKLNNESDLPFEVLWRIYDKERLLINYHAIRHIIEGSARHIDSHADELTDSIDELKMMVELVEEMLTTRVSVIQKEYDQVCAEHDYPVHEGIRDNGKIDPELPSWKKRMMIAPI